MTGLKLFCWFLLMVSLLGSPRQAFSPADPPCPLAHWPGLCSTLGHPYPGGSPHMRRKILRSSLVCCSCASITQSVSAQLTNACLVPLMSPQATTVCHCCGVYEQPLPRASLLTWRNWRQRLMRLMFFDAFVPG